MKEHIKSPANQHMNKIMPEHHRRYAMAWTLHCEPNCSQETKIILEKEMDNAQNHFSWDEFQAFKQTLPGFVEFWKTTSNNMTEKS